MAKLSVLLALGLILLLGQHVQSNDSNDSNDSHDSDNKSRDKSHDSNHDSDHESSQEKDDTPKDLGEYFSFPELVGKTGEEAKEAILADHPNLNVILLKQGSPITMDWRPSRVRVFVDDHGIVAEAPYNG